ncbi:MAG: hypothetical protein WBC21_02465 [Minisyncoccales bacterium]
MKKNKKNLKGEKALNFGRVRRRRGTSNRVSIGGLILIMLLEIVGSVFLFSPMPLIQEVQADTDSGNSDLEELEIKQDIALIKDREFINDLRTNNSVIKRGNITKTYNAFEKKLSIENKNLDRRIELKLNSSYLVSVLIASDDTKVAELILKDYKNTNLFEEVKFYDIKNNYQEVEKILKFKYGIEKEKCDEIECHSYTEWTEFQGLNELPHKNIKIGIFTKTEVNEHIEWIPKIQGFEILEWAAWDVSSAEWLQAFYVGGEETFPTEIFFKPDGTKMYIIGYSGDDVNEYDLDTPWDVSTAVWLQLFYVGGEETFPTGLFFKPDGTKMYVMGSNGDDVNEYDLDTPWDISTAVWLQAFYVGGEETSPYGLFFKPDGTKMYVVGIDSGNVNEYDLPLVVLAVNVGETVIFSSTASDSDIDTATDTVKLFVCKTDSLTSCSAGCASGTWASASLTASNPSATHAIAYTDGVGNKNFYGFVCDSHNFAASSSISGEFYINPALTFSITDTSIGFGELTTSDDFWATSNEAGSASEPGAADPIQITVSTNAPNGALVSARSKGNGTGVEGNGSAGLYKSSSPAHLVAAVASSTITAGGTEGYGLYVKQVGSNLTAAAGFDNNGSNDIAISATNQTILTASGVISSNNTADIVLKTAISASTKAGSYSDVLTLVATGKY